MGGRVLAFSIAAEGTSMHACLKEVNKSRGAHSVLLWFSESRQAELIVIFGEDLAALLGLTLALTAILVAVATGNPMWDAIGTMCIGLLLIAVAVFVAIEVKGMLIGQSADPTLNASIKQFIEAQPQVQCVFKLITLQLGNDVRLSVKA